MVHKTKSKMEGKCLKYSDTGNRTPGYRVRGDNVSHYTISDDVVGIRYIKWYFYSSSSRKLNVGRESNSLSFMPRCMCTGDEWAVLALIHI
jgi:hypothetical protein